MLHITTNYTLTMLCCSPHNICNEESKYNGMEGNRRLYGDVIAGPMFLVGDDGYGGFCDLTDRQIREYGEQFAEPEDISPEEVEKALRFDFYGL